MIKILICFFVFCLPAQAGNLFELGKVQYFAPEDKLHHRPAAVEESIDWREPVMAADGTMHYYSPPPAVLRLLNDPSPKNARAYMQWQRRRTQRILKAQQALSRLSGERGGP